MIPPFEKDIINCLDVLHLGGIILYPTDTIWGIGCDAMNEQAVKKIYDLKQRQHGKSMIVLVAEDRSILHYVAAPNVFGSILNFICVAKRIALIIRNGSSLKVCNGSRGVLINCCFRSSTPSKGSIS